MPYLCRLEMSAFCMQHLMWQVTALLQGTTREIYSCLTSTRIGKVKENPPQISLLLNAMHIINYTFKILKIGIVLFSHLRPMQVYHLKMGLAIGKLTNH